MSSFSIKELRDQLDLWRSHNPDSSKPAPDYIFKEIAKIIPNSSLSYIAKRLNLDSKYIQKKLKATTAQDSSMAFIELATVKTTHSPPTQPNKAHIGKVEYLSKSGTQINFHLPDLNLVGIAAFLKEQRHD